MINLVRVDHRLLHGQVAFSWTKVLGTNCILIANDSVASDQLRMSALRMAKPEGVKLVIKNMKDSIDAINSGVTDKYTLLVLVETVEDANRLTDGVPSIKKVNLGGAKSAPDKKQISKAFFLSENEAEMIKSMEEKGINLFIQMVPEDPSKDISEII